MSLESDTLRHAGSALEKSATQGDRAILLQKVKQISDVLAADVVEAERIRTLPQTSVAALRASKLYGLKTPACVGGYEASLADQLAVFEETAYVNPSAGWNLFVSSAGLGIAAAHLPDAGLQRLFTDPDFPTFASGGGFITGKLVPTEGGYRLSGRWVYGSGIKHADWVAIPARVVSDNEADSRVLTCIVPACEFEIFDTWHVMGLAGSGSHDYGVENVYVPKEMTFCRADGPARGGAIYRLGPIGYVTVEIVGFMIGVARRALDELIQLSVKKSRGYVSRSSLAQRHVLQRAVAEADLKLKAARALNLDVFERATVAAGALKTLPESLEIELRAASTFAAETTIEIANMAFRYAAGSAMRLESPLQRCLRDLHAAGTHFVVSDTAYESHGQRLLGLTSGAVMS